VERVALIARFDPEQAEQVRELLEEGPPYDLAESTIDRHAVYLSSREVVFVFEGPDVQWQVEDIADEFFHPAIRSTLADWRKLVDEEPRLGHPVFAWERGSPATGAAEAAAELVGDVMEKSFVLVAPEDTLGEAVERMVARAAGPALVGDYGRLIGVLSAEDVLRATAERVHPSEGRVREWMSDPAATLAPDASLAEAMTRMVETASHHLPVVEDERPVGVVDLRSVVSAGAALPI
jgi:CBS domain-containing protein